MAAALQVEFQDAPVTSDSRIFFDASYTCVTSTPYLGWDPAPAGAAGNARVSLTFSQWFAAFGGALRSGPSPADKAAAAAAKAIRLRLTGDRITRWMITLTNANVFSAMHSCSYTTDLHKVISAASIPMPESEVLAGDYALGDELVIPTGGGAAAARRRAAFEPLRFLSLASAGLLEKPSDSLPWAAMAELQGVLGSFFTADSREDEMSYVQTFTTRYTSFHRECGSAAALAMALRDFDSDIRLPTRMRPTGVTTEELYAAAIDGMDYHTPARRPRIEERRIDLLLREVRSRLYPY